MYSSEGYLWSKGDPAGAISAAAQAADLDPSNLDYLITLGDYQMPTEGFVAANETYARAMARADAADRLQKARLFNNLAYAYAVENVNLDSAAVLVTRALELAGETPSMLDTRAWVLYRQGRCAEALAPMKAVRDSLVPGTNVEIDEHYIAIHCACGDRGALTTLFHRRDLAAPGATCLTCPSRRHLFDKPATSLAY